MAENRIRFTKAALEAIEPPAQGARRYFDDKTPGLILRVTAKGNKTFYVYKKVDGRPAELRVGSTDDLTIEQARKKADELRGQIAIGEDPAAQRREARQAKTFGELFEWYVEQPKKNGERGARTIAEYRKLALVRAVFNRAIKKGLMKGANPAAGVEAFAEHGRDRRIQPHEAARFLAAVAEEPSADIRDYVLISLYCGARKTNVLEARWDQVDLLGRTWRIPVTKNGTAQTIPLEDAEIAILTRRKLASSSAWVFPGSGASGHLADPKAGWARILARAGILDLRLHDLRRSLASFMVDSGASLPVVGKALHHQSQATTAIYARLSLDPVREAKRAAHGAIHAAASNVIPIAAASSAPARKSGSRGAKPRG